MILAESNHCHLYSIGNNVYPRIMVTEGGDPSFIKIMADYEFMNFIYPGKDLIEISKFDDIFTKEVSRFTKKRRIYLKFYSINPEYDGIIYYPIEYIISIEYVAANFQIDVVENDRKIPTVTESCIRHRRPPGIKAIYNIAKNLFDKKFSCLCQYENQMLVSNGGHGKLEILKDYITRFEIHQFSGCPTTIKEYCQLREYPNCM